MFKSTSPQIDVSTLSSSKAQFNQYNNHDHVRVSPPDFRAFNLKRSDSVWLYDEYGEEVLGKSTPATITSIKETELVLSVSSSKDVQGGTLYCVLDRDNVLSISIQNVSITKNSTSIKFTPNDNFLDIQHRDDQFGISGPLRNIDFKQALTHSVQIQNHDIISSVNNFVLIDPYLDFNSRILSLTCIPHKFLPNVQLIYFDPTIHVAFNIPSSWGNYGSVKNTTTQDIPNVFDLWSVQADDLIVLPKSSSIGLSFTTNSPVDPDTSLFVKLQYLRVLI